jgi:xylulose-5-phosphate/fructose-6-phosphate phosphoketolase
VDGKPAESNWRSHQVPLDSARENDAHRAQLEEWLRSYKPEELFDEQGHPTVTELAPVGDRRMSANPVANGGLIRQALRLPDFRDYAVDVPTPGATVASATGTLGDWLRDVIRDNPTNFRLFGPDEVASNRLQAAYEVTAKQWDAEYDPIDVDNHLARAGRVMEVLSEHQCQGWLEGYLLTGRHGVFTSYEAFIHIVDSMVNQHAKWLRTSRHLPWRSPVSSLNYLLSSHVWRQDHNGASHQDPGFIDHVVNKKPEVVRVYLPFDANTLLSTYDHVLRSTDYVNVVVAGKQPSPQWLTMQQAIDHCTRGLGILDWAGTERDGEAPDVVLGCAGDVPTIEALAAAEIIRLRMPEVRLRVVNVVDLMRLLSAGEHPHGLSDREYDALFTKDKPVVFAYHGYPWLIHRLTYKRNGHANLHVRGFKDEGTTTTPFDMVMLNDIDRYRLVMDVIDQTPGLVERYAPLRQELADARLRARQYTREHGEDIPEVTDWAWDGGAVAVADTGGDNS